MIGCLRTRVRKQPIIALYFESETVVKFYNFEALCLFGIKVQSEHNINFIESIKELNNELFTARLLITITPKSGIIIQIYVICTICSKT